MGEVYRTARGNSIDMARLKLQNETVIAVGNSNTNARGDVLKNGKVVKTREQVAQEAYNLNGNNIVKDAKIRHSAADIEPDVLPEVKLANAYEAAQKTNEPTVLAQKEIPNAPRGGLANAVSKSKEIADVLEAQRKRI